MTKQDLIDAVADKTDLTKAQAGTAIEAALDSITNAMTMGDKVSLVGFGTFEVRERKAREGRNPQTGQTIMIAASRVPAFKAGKKLKDAVA